MPETWIIIAVAVLVAAVLGALLMTRGRRGEDAPPPAAAAPAPGPAATPTPAEPSRPRAAIVVNPTKFDDVADVRRRITEGCRAHGWDDPLWLETTEDDPGSGQTKQAIEAGVDVVCPLGGDGTVRTVGAELTDAGAPVPLGLLPGGTGNLLARNLDLPVDSLEDALTIALTGTDRRVDVGMLTVRPAPTDGEHEVDDRPVDADAVPPQDEGPERLHFLVMAGMGFDADVMDDAPEALKARMGWPAYVVSGLKHLWGPQFKCRVTTDDQTFSRRARSVLIGNCGRLQGITLIPEAVIDDGRLDAMVLSPAGGVGWGVVALRIATAKHKGHHRVTHHSTTHLDVRADREVKVQVDGDTIGERRAISADVLPQALVVRVAGPSTDVDTGSTRTPAG